jgi:flavorubredoxin
VQKLLSSSYIQPGQGTKALGQFWWGGGAGDHGRKELERLGKKEEENEVTKMECLPAEERSGSGRD